MSAVAEPRSSGRTDALFAAWLFVLALAPRLYVALAWPREPVWDGHYYDFGARRIAAGLGYSDGVARWHPWCHWPVGYSGLLAGVYRVFGAGPHVATVASAVIGAAIPVAVFGLARHAASPWRARLAGALAAADPGLIVYAALVMTEPLAALLLLVAAWLVVRERPAGLRGLVLGGVAMGLGTLVRPTFLAHAPWLAWLRREGPPRRWVARALAGGALVTAVVVAVVAPWTLRNCRVMDRCAFVSTNGGWNLAIGALPRATGRFETLRATDGCPVVTGQVQQDSCWRDAAIEAIRRDPVRWLALVPRKLGYTFDHESFAVEYLHEADPDRWPEPRRVAGRGWLTLVHRLLLTLAAFGVVARPRRGLGRAALVGLVARALVVAALAWWAWTAEPAAFWPLAVAIAALGLVPMPGAPERSAAADWAVVSVALAVATHAVFFGEDRYHMVVTPMLCLLAALALRPPAEARDRLGC